RAPDHVPRAGQLVAPSRPPPGDNDGRPARPAGSAAADPVPAGGQDRRRQLPAALAWANDDGIDLALAATSRRLDLPAGVAHRGAGPGIPGPPPGSSVPPVTGWLPESLAGIPVARLAAKAAPWSLGRRRGSRAVVRAVGRWVGLAWGRPGGRGSGG